MTMALDEAAKGGGSNNTGSPDPTNATTQMILREIGALKELTAAQADAIEQRVAAIDKAIELAHDDFVRWPTDVEREIGTITKVFDTKLAIRDERFGSIDKQFIERNERFKHGSIENKSAVEAALQAAKESVTKSEVGFTKQIEQQGIMISTVKSELEKRIDDLKERVTGMAASRTGGIEVRKESRESLGAIVGVGGAVVGFVAVIASLFFNR